MERGAATLSAAPARPFVAETRAPQALPPEHRDPWGPFLRDMTGVGLNSFGGPVAQIGVMHRLAVERRGWLEEGQFLHLLNFANILPGPEALELAVHLGYIRRGVAGGIAAGLLFVWPGFVTLSLLAWVYTEWGEIAAVSRFLDGVRPVAMALVASAAWRISRRALRGGSSWLLAILSFLASFLWSAPFLAILLCCGIAGAAIGRPDRSAAPHAAAPAAAGRRRLPAVALIVALVAGAAIWRIAAPSGSSPAGERPAAGALILAGDGSRTAPGARQAPQAPLAAIGWVNTKAALVTFGGAYTVLPYLREQVVEAHGWLTDRQVIDALALGETTPGPLICVGVFLAFLAGGWPGALVGGACLFLPSFVLVLTLGRFIESIERIPRARDLLWGFSAGTLGLILALAAALVPQSLPDPPSWALAAAAFSALHALRGSPLLVVAAGGAMGLLGLA